MQQGGTVSSSSLIITLLNTRSLNKHAIDILHDSILVESDIIGITETQLQENWDTSERYLGPLHVVLNNMGNNRFSNLAFAYRNSLTLLDHDSVPNASFFQISKESFLPYNINILLLYLTNTMQWEERLYTIQYFLSRHSDIHIIFGDFNIDALNGSNRISDFLSHYEMVVTEATHISGSLLDHVYVLRSLFEQVHITSIIKSLYFTDHEAVKIILQPK